MKKLQLAKELSLPADEAVTQKYGFIGRSGSGKSYASMKLAELFLGAGAQIIALDWVGIWWSLRLAGNGKAPGFEHVYIFGGEHADVELRPESGALMADLIVDKHISVVLDVMHFRKAERTRFATAFAEQFFHRKKTARTACHLFIEEAQAYLPQMVRGDEARMVGVFEDIGKVGRNYGIGTTLISQRPQAINKDVLNQVEVLLAFQTNGPQERKAIAGWTAENTTAGAAMMQRLPALEIGHALVWSPQWLRVAQEVTIAARDTYNASSTPTQNAKTIAPKRLSPAELEDLGESVKQTIEKAKADDPKELKRQIQALKLENSKMSISSLSVSSASNRDKKQEVKQVPALTDADRALIEKLAEGLRLNRVKAYELIQKAEDAAQRRVQQAMAEYLHTTRTIAQDVADNLETVIGRAGVQKLLEKLNGLAIAPASPLPRTVTESVRHLPTQHGSSTVVPPPSRHTNNHHHTNNNGHLPPGELAVLTAALTYPNLERQRLTVLTGYKRSSRDAYIARLTQKGLISVNGQAITATPEGVAALPDFEPLPTGQALVDYWRARLPEGERRILDVLLEQGGDVAREVIDHETNYKRSSRDAYLVRMKARGVIEIADRGMVRASAELQGR